MKSKTLAAVAATALAAALVLSPGCDRNKRRAEDEQLASGSKYKLLKGTTSDKGDIDPGPEPELSVDTRFAAGRLAETQGRFPAAVEQYEAALKLKPQHVATLYRLGVVHTKMKQFDQAAAVWRKYITATGDIASGYSNLGFCHEMAGDVASAEKAYKEGIQRDPQSMPCRTNYGLMLARHDRIEEAETQLRVVLKPDQVRYNLAAVYEQKGQMQQAKAELKKAIEINPKNQEAQMKLAGMPMD